MGKNVLVLGSGGIDSTACIHYYITNGYSPMVLFVDYNQPARLPEQSAVTSICEHYKVSLQTIHVSGINWKIRNKDELIGRNLVFASLGVASFPSKNGLIAMGIHDGSDYLDCSQEFQNKLRDLSQLVSSYLITFDFPFGNWNKSNIVSYCRDYLVPLELTYSCVRGTNPPCGECLSCEERQAFNL